MGFKFKMFWGWRYVINNVIYIINLVDIVNKFIIFIYDVLINYFILCFSGVFFL